MAMYRHFKEKASDFSDASSSAEPAATSTGTDFESTERPTKSKKKEKATKSPHKIHVPKSFKSSVVLVPPESVWKQINNIRRVHDKGFKRWMAHINLLYPFIPDVHDGSDFTQAASKIKEHLSTIQPFTVSFPKQSFGYFKHSKSCTMWLKPLIPGQVDEPEPENKVDDMEKQEAIALKQKARKEKKLEIQEEDLDDIGASGLFTETGHILDQVANDETKTDNKEKPKNSCGKKSKSKKEKDKQPSPPTQQNFHPSLLQIQSKLEELYPDFKDLSTISEWGFQPHLSLGQFKANEVEPMMQEFQESWTDIEFVVNEIFLISRADFDDPFHIRHSIPLAHKNDIS